MKNIIKNGKNKYGVQIYYDKIDEKYFIKDEDRRSISFDTKELAIKMYIEEGISYRKIGRILDISHVSVIGF